MPKNWLQHSFDPDAYEAYMQQEQRNKQHQTDIFNQIFGITTPTETSENPSVSVDLSPDAKILFQHIERIIRTTNSHFPNLKPFKPTAPPIQKMDVSSQLPLIDLIASNGPYALDIRIQKLRDNEWMGSIFLTNGTSILDDFALYRAETNQMLQQISEGLLELLKAL